MRSKRTCPVCGRTYTEPPAISRMSKGMEICPECGTREAIEDWNRDQEERTDKRTETRACDLISRQAAIDEITEYGSGDTVYMSVVELKRRIEQLPPAQLEQRWIPCCERLPEDYEDVLITYTHSFELTCPQETAKLLKGVKTVSGNPIDPKVAWEVPFADYIAFYDVDEKRWFSPTDNPEPFPDEIKVIAWMPLPEPYKECGTERRTDETD